eukprot:15388571-Alexandrium_andersonii.AAC.1
MVQNALGGPVSCRRGLSCNRPSRIAIKVFTEVYTLNHASERAMQGAIKRVGVPSGLMGRPTALAKA